MYQFSELDLEGIRQQTDELGRRAINALANSLTVAWIMAGTITICSTGDGSLLSGHSWIEFASESGDVVTYGTWGNNPVGQGNGLHRNLELGRVAEARKSAWLTDQQEVRLLAKIKEYEQKGQAGWGYLNPCSAFAADAWRAATGERLKHRNRLMISNPSTLTTTILEG